MNMAKLCALVLRTAAAGYLMTSSNSFQIMPLSSNNNLLPSSFCFRDPTKALFMSNNDPTPEESAKALGDYMAKAHEAKLKAIADIKNQKDTEIKALRGELDSLKASRGNSIELASSQPSPVAEGSTDELLARLASYQKFMADYVVKSSEEKYRAVRDAEANYAKKYEEKLTLMLGSSSSSSGSGSSSGTDSKAKEITTFDKRNANVVAAAKAGKTRWSASEVEKANSLVNGVKKAPSLVSNPPKSSDVVTPPTTPTPPKQVASTVTTTTTTTVESSPQVPVEVTKADHGLRADGGVDGLTLAERVKNGSKVPDVGDATASDSNNNVPAEPTTNNKSVPPSPPPPTEKAALNNAEQQTASTPTPTTTTTDDVKLVTTTTDSVVTTETKDTFLFDVRNERVTAAAKAGKNYRWNDREVEKAEADAEGKILNPASSDTTTPPPPPPVILKPIPEVEEADKGLRADGGVSGPSLLERVNLGAAMLQ